MSFTVKPEPALEITSSQIDQIIEDGEIITGFLGDDPVQFVGNVGGYQIQYSPQNIGIGSNSLKDSRNSTTQGNCAIALGAGALMRASALNLNNDIAIGREANIGGNSIRSIAIGQSALGNARELSSDNISIGSGSGSSQGGSNNINLGNYSGGGISDYSISIGHAAGWSGSVSTNNQISIGYLAGRNKYSGGAISIGYEAGRHGGSGGGYEIAIGFGALKGTLGVSSNSQNTVAIGRLAAEITTGRFNTAIGSFAGQTLTTGENNTLVGYDAQPSSATVSNTITLGNTSITTLRCAVTTITSLSDERDKKDISDISYGLDLINELRPVQFEWNTRDGEKTGQKDIGFIAQELASLEDSLDAHEILGLTYRDNPEKLEASYGRLVPILVKAVQELSARIEQLEA